MPHRRWPTLTLLCLLLLVALGTAAVPFFLPKPAQVELRLLDASFDQPLGGLPVQVTDLRTGRSRSGTVQADGAVGHFDLHRLRSGLVELEVQVQGFRPSQVSVEVPPLSRLPVNLNLTSIFGRVRITVVDARSKAPLTQARLSRQEGEVLQVSGPTTLLLPAGRHPLRAEAPGHCPGLREVTVAEGEDVEILLPLSPVLNSVEAARVVLDWDESPRDIDAHFLLEGATIPVSKPHVYFGAKKGSADDDTLFAELDVDHTNSEGFETMTLYHGVPGTFRYFLHHYAGEGTLGTSQATIAVATQGCKQKLYHVAQDCSLKFWSVVDLHITAGKVNILERNHCSNAAPRRWRRRKGKER